MKDRDMKFQFHKGTIKTMSTLGSIENKEPISIP